MPEANQPYLSKDFIETAEGLCFAVVQSGIDYEAGKERVLCFLRYVKCISGKTSYWQKVGTEQACLYLKQHFPEYLCHSTSLDAYLHAVDLEKISHHYRPRQRLQEILASQEHDKIEEDVTELSALFEESGLDLTKMGVTGSLLINAQQQTSDIDIVIYDRDVFHQARHLTQGLINNGQLGWLSNKDWRDAFARRSCTLDLQQYVWHEQRKYNKALINGRKFDLNFVSEQIGKPIHYHKLGNISVRCNIIDDFYSYDYPALYAIDHDDIKTAVCFIATYTGQAVVGEQVEIAGMLEQSELGEKRIVVGSSREAPGEYIKVLHG